MRFEALAAATTEITFSCDVTPHSLKSAPDSSEEPRSSACVSEVTVQFYKTTQRYFQEDTFSWQIQFTI
jgi:hypothetical protein